MPGFQSPNSQEMRAIAAQMSKKSHGTMSHGFHPGDLNEPLEGDYPVGAGGGELGSLKTPPSVPKLPGGRR